MLGISGIFFKARDPERLRAWYGEHLGPDVAEWGGVVFEGTKASPGGRRARTVWSVFPSSFDVAAAAALSARVLQPTTLPSSTLSDDIAGHSRRPFHATLGPQHRGEQPSTGETNTAIKSSRDS